MLFLKLTKLDVVIGIGIAVAVSVSVNAICIVLAQVFAHVYIR